MKKFNLSSKFYFPVLLALTSVVLCIANYLPGTYLSGWDTIHPEFYFADYFKRVLSVWQEHQGLGAVASQAHASELPRLVIYYLTSLFLPESFLRYFFFFICLVVGPLGIYYFIKEFLYQNISEMSKRAVALSGGLLYLLNLTTLQHFSVPLEMFATHYALIGWVFLFATKYLVEGSKKSLIFFALTIFLTGPMAHTPTLFYVFSGVFLIYLLIWKFLKKTSLKRIGAILLLTFGLNAYWILPNIYFVINYGESVANSKIHYQFSDRAFQIGTNFGNIRDTALLRNFLFDWGQYDVSEGKFEPLLNSWNSHFSNPLTNIVGALVFITVLLGMAASVIKRNRLGIALLPVFLVPYFFINNDNFLFYALNEFLTDKVPVLKESLRFPFTKFSILLLFSYCIYFSFALASFISYLSKKSQKIKEKTLSLVLTTVIAVGLIFFMLPAFRGNLISDNVKVKIPDTYFNVYDYFRQKGENDRIALLPLHTFWGWYYYDWGFEGAGFNWFGVRQPLLDREFDRWNPNNENYYWESSYALYSNNLALFEKVLEKYQVKYLWVDYSVIDASSSKAPYLDEFEQMISSSNKIKLEKTFDKIKIFKFENNNLNYSPLRLTNNLKSVGPDYVKNNFDSSFADNNDYITQETSSDPDVFYPFRSLFSNRSPKQTEFSVEETNDEFIFKKPLPENSSNYDLVKPDFDYQQFSWYGQNDLDQSGSSVPTLSMNGSEIRVAVPKVKNYYSAEINPVNNELLKESKNCDYLGAKRASEKIELNTDAINEEGQKLLRIQSKHANNCTAQYLLRNLSHDLSYLIKIESRNVKGKSLLFWLENLNQKKIDIETYLPQEKSFTTSYLIQPPMEEFGAGYSLHFDNWSFNRAETVNDIKSVSLYPIPYEFLIGISLKKKDVNTQQISSNCPIKVSKKAPYWYTVSAENDCGQNPVLILGESFDSGWMAFENNKVLPHFKISSWANGWKVTSNAKQITVFFVPQLLQFLGYGILVILVVLLLKVKGKTNQS